MKRWLVKIAVLLALGAIVNVAVAWACALWSHWGPVYAYSVYREMNADAARDLFRRYAGLHITRSIDGMMLRIDTGVERRDAYLIEDGGTIEVAETIAGWPMRSVRGGIHRVLGQTSASLEESCAAYNGWMVSFRHVSWLRLGWPNSTGYLSTDMPMLPYEPIWPGFAINTVFYAAILWLLFAAPFQLRRWRRIKRGRCPACAYPVGSSEVCTECGKGVKEASP